MAGELSGGTTNLSNLSVGGTDANSAAFGTIWAGSAISAPSVNVGSILTASRVSSSATIQGNAIWASSFSVGGGQIVGFSTLSVLIPAQVVQGSASSFTVGVWSGLQLGDVIITSVAAGDGTASSLSSGLVPHSHVTATGRYEFRYSNVSTLVQNQSAKSFNLVAIRPF